MFVEFFYKVLKNRENFMIENGIKLGLLLV